LDGLSELGRWVVDLAVISEAHYPNIEEHMSRLATSGHLNRHKLCVPATPCHQASLAQQFTLAVNHSFCQGVSIPLHILWQQWWGVLWDGVGAQQRDSGWWVAIALTIVKSLKGEVFDWWCAHWGCPTPVDGTLRHVWLKLIWHLVSPWWLVALLGLCHAGL